MKNLKYTIIKTEKQYFEYCNILEDILEKPSLSQEIQDEIDLLTLLIEKWDTEHNTFTETDPIELLKGLMANRGMKAKDMVKILGISKGIVSEILGYRKGLSKEVIRKLAACFSVSQEAFNRPYKLINPINSHLKDASVMNSQKELETAS
jgi:HTH-type transcriptional regulator / antitoxin HigA